MKLYDTQASGIKRSLFRLVILVIPMVLLLVLTQTAFAENTYVITDGSLVLVHTSSATDPEAVLDEAGLTLGADDTYTATGGLGVSEITVRRSQKVHIKHGDETLTVSTGSETVQALLSRLNIPTGEGTTVSVDLDAVTYDGMQITVSCSTSVTQTYTVAVPYTTIYCNDPSLPAGIEVVLTEGVDGQARCVADVYYTDGQEVCRNVRSRTVVQQPVNQVVAVGSGDAGEETANQLYIGDGVIVTPDGEVLSFTSAVSVKATAYTHTDEGCDMYTATGTTVAVGTVAVDPRLIPYGTRMFIVSDDGQYIYGIATAEDCGGAIKGNRIDLYFPTDYECVQFGVRGCTVYILGDAALDTPYSAFW